MNLFKKKIKIFESYTHNEKCGKKYKQIGFDCGGDYNCDCHSYLTGDNMN